MNFLAHLWLADRSSTSLAGAILGDMARGPDLSAYPDEIAHGIRLHRRVDAATDRHPLIVSVREHYVQGQRRYAGIVLDLACDHVLANGWARYGSEPLPSFCTRAAAAVADAAPWFEHAGGRAIEAERFTQLLLSYGTAAGIEHAIRRTAGRMRQPQGLLEAARHWQRSAADLQEALPRLLDDLQLVMSENQQQNVHP